MKIKSLSVSRSEMKKRVARFADLRGFDGGLPDSRHPDAIRTLYNVIGFQPPDDTNKATTSPVGDHASEASACLLYTSPSPRD